MRCQSPGVSGVLPNCKALLLKVGLRGGERARAREEFLSSLDFYLREQMALCIRSHNSDMDIKLSH